VPLLKKLVELGADPLLKNASGTTALMAATGVGVDAPEEAAGTEPEVLEAVELLLKLGNDVNAVDKDIETAMHGAAYRNHPKVVQLLADKGAKIDVWYRANKTGLTPLVIAQGYRPRLNFRPAPDTVAAIHRVMLAAGLTPPQDTGPPKGVYRVPYADKK
jgi:ankyrin repeat protein